MNKDNLVSVLDWLLMMQIITYEQYTEIHLKSLPFVE